MFMDILLKLSLLLFLIEESDIYQSLLIPYLCSWKLSRNHHQHSGTM